MSAKLSINLLLRANFYRLWRSASFWTAVNGAQGGGHEKGAEGEPQDGGQRQREAAHQRDARRRHGENVAQTDQDARRRAGDEIRQIQVGAGMAHGDLVADCSVTVLRADEEAAKGGEDPQASAFKSRRVPWNSSGGCPC